MSRGGDEPPRPPLCAGRINPLRAAERPGHPLGRPGLVRPAPAPLALHLRVTPRTEILPSTRRGQTALRHIWHGSALSQGGFRSGLNTFPITLRPLLSGSQRGAPYPTLSALGLSVSNWNLTSDSSCSHRSHPAGDRCAWHQHRHPAVHAQQ